MTLLIPPDEAQDGVLLAGINTTPLVDVMLVLLIIFLITIPVVTRSVVLTLPSERSAASQPRSDSIVISVDRKGQLFWFDTRVADTDALARRLNELSARVQQPEVQIRGDRQASFEGVGRVLAACQRAGVAKVSFITEPAALR
jgi:biopolymer transport protein ExbD